MRQEARTTEPRPNFIRDHAAKIVLFAACEFAFLGIGIKSHLDGNPVSLEEWKGLATFGIVTGTPFAVIGEPLLRLASAGFRRVTRQINRETPMSEALRLPWERPVVAEDYDPNIA